MPTDVDVEQVYNYLDIVIADTVNNKLSFVKDLNPNLDFKYKGNKMKGDYDGKSGVYYIIIGEGRDYAAGETSKLLNKLLENEGYSATVLQATDGQVFVSIDEAVEIETPEDVEIGTPEESVFFPKK